MAKKLRTNEKNIVMVAAQGQVTPHVAFGVEVAHDGRAMQVPGVGGITYRPRIGDPVRGWVADHVEPGVSSRFGSDARHRTNATYQFLCCCGNEATLLTGPAKGKKGRVIGHHGGVENVIVDFPLSVLKKMTIDDKMMVTAYGQGLQLLDAPQVTVMNCDPGLLNKVITNLTKGRVEVPVAAVVGPEMMGSGLGATSARTGDYDIMMTDESLVKKYKIDSLKFGDLVGIQDHHAEWGWTLKKGARAVGVVIHSDSFLAGHGPGTTTILSSPQGKIDFKINKNANVGRYLGCGIFSK